MKATINLEGRLILKAESELEGWAMQKWAKQWTREYELTNYPAESMLLICAPDRENMEKK